VLHIQLLLAVVELVEALVVVMVKAPYLAQSHQLVVVRVEV
jgi:hypothetical protein